MIGAGEDEGDGASIAREPQKEMLLICRYGAGCTHLLADPSHGQRYYHPPTNRNIPKKNFICNECGECFAHIEELQTHLQRKTAWSNQSLIGCRICCLINNKEWHEGYVTQFQRSGRHYVHFMTHGEGVWLNMPMMTFHIIERRSTSSGDGSVQAEGEYKDGGEQWHGTPTLQPTDDCVFMDTLSLEFTFAQSVLTQIYGLIETGHKTRGHTCITESELSMSRNTKDSFLYGELLPRGVNKALGATRLNASAAKVLFDLGMGTGKIPIQAFLQFSNLELVYGVELSQARFEVAETAALDLVDLLGADKFIVTRDPGRSIRVEERVAGTGGGLGGLGGLGGVGGGRALLLECGNMFGARIDGADIVMLETEIPPELHPALCHLLRGLKPGARMLSYLDLRQLWAPTASPLRRLESNKFAGDRYSTSWSVQRGHHFFLWVRANEIASDHGVRHRSSDAAPSSFDSLNPFSFFFGDRSSNQARLRAQQRDVMYAMDRRPDGIRVPPAAPPGQGESTSCLPGLGLFSNRSRRSSRSSNADAHSPEAVSPGNPADGSGASHVARLSGLKGYFQPAGSDMRLEPQLAAVGSEGNGRFSPRFSPPRTW